MFGDIFGKLQDMQQKVDEIKSRLDTVSVAGKSPDGRITVIANGNRVIKSIEISEELRNGDPEELEDQIIIAMNKALEKAEQLNSTSMAEAGSDLLPPHLMNLLNNSR